jgi:ankyrin repeat protein
MRLKIEIIADSDLWASFSGTMQGLKDIYTKSIANEPVDISILSDLIDTFNHTRAYTYKSIPQYKFYFLSSYLLKALQNQEADITHFLYFLFINGACLDGISVIKDFLIWSLFQEQIYFDFLLYLFETQQFKVEEQLTLMNQTQDNLMKLVKPMDLQDQFMLIKAKYDKKLINPNAEVLTVDPCKEYDDEPFFKPNSCVYLNSGDFLYFDLSGRIQIARSSSTPEKKLLFLVNMGSLFGQQELLANEEQIAAIEYISESKIISLLQPQDHLIHHIHKHLESPFSTYLLNHCAQITYAQDTALMLATRFGAYDLMGFLLKNKRVDINSRNNRQEDALTIAIQQGDKKAVEMLLKYKASVLNINNSTKKQTAFHVAALYYRVDILYTLADYANSSKQQFGTLFSQESNTLFHWMLQNKLLYNNELIDFIRHCDLEHHETDHAKQIEQSLYDLFCFAYEQENRELLKQLCVYLCNSQRFSDKAFALIKLLTLIIPLPFTLIAAKQELPGKTNKNDLNNETELLEQFNSLLPRSLPGDLPCAATKLALFACKHNQPKITHQIISTYKINLKNVMHEDTHLLYECLSNRAYSSATWLITNQEGCPKNGFDDLQAFITESIGEQGHYGHELIREQQQDLLLALFSLGCFDQYMNTKDHEGNTMLDAAISWGRTGIIADLITRIQSMHPDQDDCHGKRI